MEPLRATSRAGISLSVVTETLAYDSALTSIVAQLDDHRGCLFSSGFDYPGRHSRWDIGFCDPAVEFTSRQRSFEFRGLNPQGNAIVRLLGEGLDLSGCVEQLELIPASGSESGARLVGILRPPPKFFPEEERSRQSSVFSVLRAVSQFFRTDREELSSFGLYGAFGYDLVLQFEDLELTHPRTGEIPDCHLFLPLDLTVVDRKREVAYRYRYSVDTPSGPTGSLAGGGAVFPPSAPDRAASSTEVTCDHAPGEFSEKVKKVIEGTRRGDYFEVVLSQTFQAPSSSPPTALFQRLAAINPSPYMFLINMGEDQLIGASPEIYVRVTGTRYETCPIAGTISRGATALEDADRVLELISSQKDESELTMCTDVDRNDMARVCIPGSVKVIGRRQLEFYSHLIHTVDHVEGYLRDGFDSLDAFQTHMWACTVTGAPKPAAMQEIERLESSPRGWYSGAIGFLAFNGNLNTGITLRTAHIRGGRASIRAGATLLFGSDPELEEKETRTKAAAFLAAITRSADTPTRAVAVTESPAELFGRASRKVLLVDYKDSFVHNLAAYLRELGAEVTTLRTGFPLEMLDSLRPELVVLSPGPGTPEEFGVPAFVGELVRREYPIFGVCLGHQGIGQHFGATLSQLPLPCHGKASVVSHTGESVFAGVEAPFEAGRYHSLYLIHDTIPSSLEVLAHSVREDESGAKEIIPMAIRHRSLPIAAVQFHPESLMTLKKNAGHRILSNALRQLVRR